MTTWLDRAAELDAADPLAHCRELFVPAGTADQPVRAYLDGNSLGRPLRSTADRLANLVSDAWGTSLIRSWDAEWMELPLTMGDRLGQVCLGAAAGQTVIGDSTTVMLYKLLHAAVAAAGSDRRQIVVDAQNFPTDRYVAEGVAAATGAELVWLQPASDHGVSVDQVRSVVGEQTAVVLLSHVAYKSAYVADLPQITGVVHQAGGLVLWDLCHSVGVLPIDLDQHNVDLAVGCTYKFLNGGPGAPAFGYVAHRHQHLAQPITGWMGHAEPFVMGPRHEPAQGMRRFLSGTPPIMGMVGLADTVELINEVSLTAIHRKAVALAEFVVELVEDIDELTLGSPRDSSVRGGHVLIKHPQARELCAELWRRQIIPDFREPDGIRLGLSPLSTSFAEVAVAMSELASLVSSDRLVDGREHRGPMR